MNDSLIDFEDIEVGNSRLKYYIVVCVSVLILGLWSVEIATLILDEFASFSMTDIGVFAGLSLFLISLLRVFLRQNKIAWLLMCLIVAFFSGAFINSIGGFLIEYPKSGEYWRFIIFLAVSLSTFTSYILLLLTKTKKDFLINNILYGFCVALCILFSIGGYILVS